METETWAWGMREQDEAWGELVVLSAFLLTYCPVLVTLCLSFPLYSPNSACMAISILCLGLKAMIESSWKTRFYPCPFTSFFPPHFFLHFLLFKPSFHSYSYTFFYPFLFISVCPLTYLSCQDKSTPHTIFSIIRCISTWSSAGETICQ